MFKIFIEDLDPSQWSAIEKVKEWAAWADQEAIRLAPESPEVDPSDYWALYSNIFSYMKDMPVKSFSGLRLHTYHLDSYTYVAPINSQPDRYILHASRLQATLPERYWIGAPHACGEYGHLQGERLLNEKVLSYQETISGLWHNGVFARLENIDRPVFLEIGGGYGGIAHHIQNLFPGALYVIVDLPATLLFSAAYLTMLHGQDKVVLMDTESPQDPAAYSDASFVMVPNFLLSHLDGFRFDFSLNMDSFQEMTERQVTTYLEFLAKRTDLLYSHNADEFEQSSDKVAVSALLRRYFDISLLAPRPETPLGLKHPYRAARRMAAKWRRRLKAAKVPRSKGGAYLAVPKATTADAG
jgi:putative sugar O-methyltransferase